MSDNKEKIPISEWYKMQSTEWWEISSFESAQEQHKKNVESLKQAIEEREKKDRPLHVVVLHGSGRTPVKSCAHEMSNSQMLLEYGLDNAIKEWKQDGGKEVTVDTFVLRELLTSACNNCVATTSALCNLPCSCHPMDDITMKIYPAILKADVILLSSGINQSMISSKLKILLDRLISLDGGYFIEELPTKDVEWKNKMVQLSLDQPVYDQRMFGRVVAYFISSKDIYNKMDPGVPLEKKWADLDYETLIIGSLTSQSRDYGWFHADPFYVIAGSDPDVEYSADKSALQSNKKALAQSVKVVKAALKMGEKHKKFPPKYIGGGRINRT